MRRNVPDQDCLRSEWTRIAGLPADELRALWQRSFKQPAPAALKGNLLLRAYAQALQEQVHGPLPLALRNRLQAALTGRSQRGGGSKADRPDSAAFGMKDRSGIEQGRSSSDHQAGIKNRGNRILPAGTRLIREWQGTHHEVVVLPDGFLWQGQIHASLSVIAHKLTGTRWNGWIFFGLKRRAARTTAAAGETVAARDGAEVRADNASLSLSASRTIERREVGSAAAAIPVSSVRSSPGTRANERRTMLMPGRRREEERHGG